MRLKTTIKLFFQHLNLVWKATLYKLFSYTLTIVLLSICAMPIITKLSDSGFFQKVTTLFDLTQFEFSKLGSIISNLTNEFLSIISSNWSNLSLSIIIFFVIATFFNYFINSFIDIPTTELLYGSMSCNARFSFGACIVGNLFKSFKYALVKTITSLIVDSFIVISIVSFIVLATKINMMAIFIPIIAIILLVILFAFKLTLFSSFAPTVVAKGYSVFKSLFKSLKFSFKNFWANFATAVALLIIIVTMNGFVILFTFFSGAIITFPATYVLISIFNMVIFYSSSGMFFYIGENNIVDNSKGVKRLEEQDTIKDLKNII